MSDEETGLIADTPSMEAVGGGLRKCNPGKLAPLSPFLASRHVGQELSWCSSAAPSRAGGGQTDDTRLMIPLSTRCLGLPPAPLKVPIYPHSNLASNVMPHPSTEWTCSEILVTQFFLLRVRHESSVSTDLKRGLDLLTSRFWLSSDCCAVSIGVK